MTHNSDNYVDGLELRIKELTAKNQNLFNALMNSTAYSDKLNQRITELEATIKSHGIPVKTYAGGEAHYVMGEPK